MGNLIKEGTELMDKAMKGGGKEGGERKEKEENAPFRK